MVLIYIYSMTACHNSRAIFPRIARSLLPVPIETLVIARAYSDVEVTTINLLLQFLGSGNTGKYSILDLNIVPPFGRADTVDLEWNISLYCPPSHAIIYNKNIYYTKYVRQSFLLTH